MEKKRNGISSIGADTSPSRRKKRRIMMHVINALVLLIGFMFLLISWVSMEAANKARALNLAQSAEVLLHSRHIAGLADDGNDALGDSYADIQASLQKLWERNPQAYAIYVLGFKNGSPYLLAGTVPAGEAAAYTPGQRWPEEQHASAVYAQRKSSWIGKRMQGGVSRMTVYVPVTDSRTSQMAAVLGMDYTMQVWNAEAYQQVVHALLLVVFLYALIGVSVWLMKQNVILSRTAQRMKNSEELFRTLFEQAPVGMLIANGQKKVEIINTRFLKMVGRNPDEIDTLDWDAITHPDDREKNTEYFEQFLTSANNGESLIKRYIRPDNTITWVDMKVVRINSPNNEENRHICIADDITGYMETVRALGESERSKTVLLSNLPGMAYRCLYDEHWTMKFVSKGCYDLSGYKPESFLDNRDLTFNEVIAPKYRPILWEEWNRTVNLKQPFRYEYEIICRSGEHKWVLEQAQAVYDEQGQVAALEGLIIDISEQKLRESQIQYLNDHDFLTGAYNRPFFESAKHKLGQEASLPVSVIIGDINGMKLINDAFGHTKGDRLLIDTAILIRNCCRETDVLARTGGDEFSILMPRTDYETGMRVMNSILKACEDRNSHCVSDIDHLSLCLGCSTVTRSDESVDNAIKAAEGYLSNSKLLNRKSSHNAVLASITATMYEKSRETEQHAERLARLSRRVGQHLQLPGPVLDQLELFATLHDIGKVGIDSHILNKPGRLTEDEWEIMKKHVQIGYRIAMATPELEPIAEYILTHHERWDGGGYPGGLKGEEIPLLSRILAVVDAYDAMTKDRPYRKGMTEQEALEEVVRNSGMQFDPAMVDIFVNQVMVPSDDGGAD